MRIYLDDGRAIDQANFEIRENPERRLDAGDKWALKWAQRLCPAGKGFCVSIATRRGVIANGFSATSSDAAVTLAVKAVALFYKKGRNRRWKTGTVAVLNFAPTPTQVIMLAAEGVDVLFPYERVEEDEPGRQQEFVHNWVGPNIGDKGKLEIQRRILLFPRENVLGPKKK